MNRTEHLLAILAEECAEVAQRATKAMRFGLTETQPGQPLDNAERLRGELADLRAVVQMIEREAGRSLSPTLSELAQKRAKVEQFLIYSAKMGTLTRDGE